MRKKLKMFRLERDLTQAQMADLIGCSLSCYHYIEQGKRSPSLSFVKKMHKAFGMTIDEVLELMESEEIREKNHSTTD